MFIGGSSNTLLFGTKPKLGLYSFVQVLGFFLIDNFLCLCCSTHYIICNLKTKCISAYHFSCGTSSQIFFTVPSTGHITIGWLSHANHTQIYRTLHLPTTPLLDVISRPVTPVIYSHYTRTDFIHAIIAVCYIVSRAALAARVQNKSASDAGGFF